MNTAAEQEVEMYYCIPIPDGDWRDIFDTQAIKMALLHNAIIRGFNSLLYYSGKVQPGTKQLNSFLRYGLENCRFIHHHHDNEETMYFPFLESKMGEGRMSSNVRGHEAFQKPFIAFEEHINVLLKDPSKWDVNTFCQGIHAFMPPLREHLVEEIDTLKSSEVAKYLKAEEIREFDKKFEEIIKAQLDFSKGPQLAYINGDGVNGAWFPPIPSFLVFLIKYAMWWPHSDMWVYGCCDKHMNVKPQFAPYEPPAKVAQ
ncbi:hypothetical protein M407DRAFT_16517 [Tulasnella calospora MUT 4182]|uniref:Hemerythrin-like domain-containing protein n=1 Tax=Tulasnella calospora MUT 4182 TaxID=1051891 RepID=A0A0C3MLF6_9AGAM|nr:hypothetical protein M407DRAFT_16517 [Tulasnella calospora MUT 4182]